MSDEKRNFFRIDDTIGLTYSTIEGDDEQPAADAEQGDFPLTRLFAEIDRKFNRLANNLYHENPGLAEALGLLNQKISAIAARALQEENQPVGPYREQKVNISASGIAFHSAEPIPAETRVRFSAALKPSNIVLNFTGRVICCEPSSDFPALPYWIRISIDGDNATAQEQLIQHIVQKQGAQLARANEDSDPKSL